MLETSLDRVLFPDSLAADFKAAFESYDVEVVAPARLNLIGEHTDYNGGYVLPFAVEYKLRTKIRLQSAGLGDQGPVWSFYSAQLAKGVRFSAQDLELLKPEDLPAFARYLIGCLAVLPCLGSADFYIDSDIPQGAGVSSSAALCCGILRGIEWVNQKLSPVVQCLPHLELAKKAAQVEREYAGTNCGLMDQLAVLASKQDALTSIHFAFEPPKLRHVRMHSFFSQYTAVAFQTGVQHNLSDSPYNERRASCERVVELINQHIKANGLQIKPVKTLGELVLLEGVKLFPFSLDRPFAEHELLEQEMLRFFVEKLDLPYEDANRATHAVLENVRVEEAMDAIEAGDGELLHAAMQRSHLSLSQRYQVSCKELDFAFDCLIKWSKELKSSSGPLPIIGPRMCGGGFGGSLVMLVCQDYIPKLFEYFEDPNNPYSEAFGIQPKLWSTKVCKGLEIFEG